MSAGTIVVRYRYTPEIRYNIIVGAVHESFVLWAHRRDAAAAASPVVGLRQTTKR